MKYDMYGFEVGEEVELGGARFHIVGPCFAEPEKLVIESKSGSVYHISPYYLRYLPESNRELLARHLMANMCPNTARALRNHDSVRAGNAARAALAALDEVRPEGADR